MLLIDAIKEYGRVFRPGWPSGSYWTIKHGTVYNENVETGYSQKAIVTDSDLQSEDWLQFFPPVPMDSDLDRLHSVAVAQMKYPGGVVTSKSEKLDEFLELVSKVDFDHLLSRIMHTEMDLGYSNGIIDGGWPHADEIIANRRKERAERERY